MKSIWLGLAGALGLTLGATCFGPSHIAYAQEKIIRIGMPFPVVPRYFDPGQVPAATSFSVLYAVGDALAKITRGSDITLSLAKSFEHNDNYTEFRYELKPGVLFHNGDEVTAEDVKFSMERYSGTLASELKSRIASIEVTGRHTVVVRTKESWPDYMAVAHTTASGFAWVVPKAYVEKVGVEGFLKQPVGAGPFELVSNEGGRTVTLKRFEKYHGQKPKIDKVVMTAVPDAPQGLAQVMAGDIDVAYGMLGELGEAAKKASNARLVYSSGYTIAFLQFFDGGKPDSPWANAKVREAVNLVLDRQALSDIDTQGASIPTASLVPPSLEYAWKAPVPKVDIARAKKLMADAGFANGFDGGNLVPLAPYWRLAEGVTAMLSQINIKMNIQKLERSVFLQRLAAKNLTGVCLCLEGPAGNASTRIARHAYSKGPSSYWTLPGYDELYEAQLKEINPQKRTEQLVGLQKMLYDSHYYAPIYILKYPVAVANRVKEPGFYVDGVSYISSFENIELN